MKVFHHVPPEACEQHLRYYVTALLAKRRKEMTEVNVQLSTVGPFVLGQLVGCMEQLERYRSEIAELKNRHCQPDDLCQSPQPTSSASSAPSTTEASASPESSPRPNPPNPSAPPRSQTFASPCAEGPAGS